jgi:glycosyltransferase involved in cell wall biosynthesis
VVAVRAEKSAASDIINGGNGIICELSELRENIVKVLSDGHLRNEITRGGYDYSKNFDWENVVEKTLEVYENLISKGD